MGQWMGGTYFPGFSRWTSAASKGATQLNHVKIWMAPKYF
jgi:hypothetical protein